MYKTLDKVTETADLNSHLKKSKVKKKKIPTSSFTGADWCSWKDKSSLAYMLFFWLKGPASFLRRLESKKVSMLCAEVSDSSPASSAEFDLLLIQTTNLEDKHMGLWVHQIRNHFESKYCIQVQKSVMKSAGFVGSFRWYKLTYSKILSSLSDFYYHISANLDAYSLLFDL